MYIYTIYYIYIYIYIKFINSIMCNTFESEDTFTYSVLCLHPTPKHSLTLKSCHSHTATVTRRFYVRLRVWKILEIWSMTGPVSGSFIHWVLLRGFSNMSSNANNVLGFVRPSCTTGFSRMA